MNALVRLAYCFAGKPPKTVTLTVRGKKVEGTVLSTDPQKGHRVKYYDPDDGVPRYIWHREPPKAVGSSGQSSKEMT
jgi:hypothetical protein